MAKKRQGHGVTLYIPDDEYRKIQRKYVPQLQESQNDYTIGVASVIAEWVKERLGHISHSAHQANQQEG